MLASEINIRDPFVLPVNGKYYMYGTRAKDFGQKTGGFDVYVSEDLVTWSEPLQVFDSAAHGLNGGVNWAPEVHFINGYYYLSATFTKPDGLRGTYILRAERPEGPFLPHSEGAVTPEGWECLDGTLYSEGGGVYMVFCHEHTQIINGTMCYIKLSDDLTRSEGEPVTMFSASDPEWADPSEEGRHFVTDGPFMHRTADGGLIMIWSTSLRGSYAQCAVKFTEGTLMGGFRHLAPLFDKDGGHGMIFRDAEGLVLTLHTPNNTGSERPVFYRVKEKPAPDGAEPELCGKIYCC